jgi:serine/threonine-protein kinase HipA
MTRCPITYEPCESGSYSQKGLDQLSRGLGFLHPLPFTAGELREEAQLQANKVGIAGSQPKLNASLSTEKMSFMRDDERPDFILKPQHHIFPFLPENEDLTMRLAALAGIEVPFHGLVYAADQSLTYFVRRFDRDETGAAIAVEDFAQLAGLNRRSKREAGMEKLTEFMEQYCSFPEKELTKLFRLVIFNYLCGNQDMHLKNYSVISKDGVTRLSPAYDLVNSTILLTRDADEIGLSLQGVRKGLTRDLLVDYFGGRVCTLSSQEIQAILQIFNQIKHTWFSMIAASFLPLEYKALYSYLVEQRLHKLML